jgi:hypothetical protein
MRTPLRLNIVAEQRRNCELCVTLVLKVGLRPPFGKTPHNCNIKEFGIPKQIGDSLSAIVASEDKK